MLALYSLRKKFAGRIKLIYIDPPYNTGNDSFGYNDNFKHSTWLTFMKNRLEVAKELRNLTDREDTRLKLPQTESVIDFSEIDICNDPETQIFEKIQYLLVIQE